jgi:superfamily II DNA or RNA helicase
MNTSTTGLLGYIYIRVHPSYENACKLGKARNIIERDSQYATGELRRGKFEAVFEIPLNDMGDLELLLQKEFVDFNIKYDGGTEFYDQKIITIIELYLIKIGVQYTKLSDSNINSMKRTYRVKKTLKKINTSSLISLLKSKRTNTQPASYTPREDQIAIINSSFLYFQQQNKGLLVLMCGTGKTLISLWITQKLNSNTILIGVPNKLLLKQWEDVIRIIFRDVPYLLIEGGVNSETITSFLNDNQEKCIVITTYGSSHKVYAVTRSLDYKFDMKINDEVHHLTSNNINEEEKKTFVNMLKIDSKKQLSLTATLKILENKENQRDENVVVSNDNVYHFGNIIDKKGLLWAIQHNVICDYVIQTIITNEYQLEHQLLRFNITEDNDQRLFLSAYASLKSISDGHSHHLLIYSNNKDNSQKLIQYIDMLINENYFDIPELYSSNYHSEMNSQKQKTIITKFENARIAIITCVYCLGEGWDFPLLDGVVFSENMTSNIRIIQSVLRANRKSIQNPNKKAKIILPILNRDDWLDNNENPDLKKVREVIYQLGLEDETIAQKIKVSRIEIEKQNTKAKENNDSIIDEFGDYDDEFTQRLQLKTTKRTAIATTYEKSKTIIAEKNIRSEEEYYKLCQHDNRLTTEPERDFHGKFRNWIDYLSIPSDYYDLDTCKNKVSEYLLSNLEIKNHYFDLSAVCDELCKIDPLFPPHGLWCEYYDVPELRNIIIIKSQKKQTGVIL